MTSINNHISLSMNGHQETGNKKATESSIQFQLKELKEKNARLENRVVQDAEILNEVIARNAKFLSIVAHDLRSPFNSIIGILDILTENINSYRKEEIVKLINIASGSAIKTYKLLENLLDWAVAQNKEKNFTPVKINLSELIVNELENFKTFASQKGVSIDHSIFHDLYAVADIQMTRTILRNLISNGIKYSNQGGIILISTTEVNQFIEIEVMDNGIGMTQNTLKKLFRIDDFQSTMGTNNEQGTGMGLIFCKEFVEMHGGKIWAESKPGKWTKFKFTIPHYL